MDDAQHEEVVSLLVHQAKIHFGHEFGIGDALSNDLQLPALRRFHQGAVAVRVLGVNIDVWPGSREAPEAHVLWVE